LRKKHLKVSKSTITEQVKANTRVKAKKVKKLRTQKLLKGTVHCPCCKAIGTVDEIRQHVQMRHKGVKVKIASTKTKAKIADDTHTVVMSK
jgi:hypothetical protein